MLAQDEDDLTGAALVALMKLSFRSQGILPAAKMQREDATPYASLSAKTRMAEDVLATHGPHALLKVGASVPNMSFDPVGAALLCAHNGQELICRWRRLERYFHKRHPIEISELSYQNAQLHHGSLLIEPASAAMDYVLSGVIAGLLLTIGCLEISLTIGLGKGAVPVIQNGTLLSFGLEPYPTNIWRYHWKNGIEREHSAAITETGANRTTRSVAAIIETDLLRNWSINEISSKLKLSPRTLQRRLFSDGSSFQLLRRKTQLKKASLLVLKTDLPISTIGFTCGFSDAAHFSRVFHRESGITPSEYRVAGSSGLKTQKPAD